jgi:CheY-like chemotaxis protein/anti-sigma regulatory factor (Ser/Thr protein kinase)
MPTILVVDDDAVHRELAVRCLKPIRNLNLLEAEDGAGALGRIASDRPDLVLTDLRMPGMDGLELVERVHEAYPFLPIILMTSFGSEQIVLRALTAGASSYVSKKDLKQDLVETVEHVLEVSHAARLRSEIFRYMDQTETRFELENNPELISPLVGYFQDNLQRLEFGDDSIRTQMGMALMEAVANAMFHGNLEVSSDLRRDNQDEYHRLAEKRRTEEPYMSRRIHVTATESRAQSTYRIEDEGPGFDPRNLPDPTAPENMVRVCGRGLLLINTFMDTVEYNQKGNLITMTKMNRPAQ